MVRRRAVRSVSGRCCPWRAVSNHAGPSVASILRDASLARYSSGSGETAEDVAKTPCINDAIDNERRHWTQPFFLCSERPRRSRPSRPWDGRLGIARAGGVSRRSTGTGEQHRVEALSYRGAAMARQPEPSGMLMRLLLRRAPTPSVWRDVPFGVTSWRDLAGRDRRVAASAACGVGAREGLEDAEHEKTGRSCAVSIASASGERHALQGEGR